MRDFKRSALVVLIGAGLAVFAASREWISVEVSDEAIPLTKLTFTGQELLSTSHALAICVLVLVLGMALTKKMTRRALAFGGALAAGLAISELISFLRNTSPAITELVAQTLGRELVQSAVALSSWPFLAVFGLIIAIIGTLSIVVMPQSGSGLSSKYERPEKREESAISADSNPWAALDAGIDPTL